MKGKAQRRHFLNQTNCGLGSHLNVSGRTTVGGASSNIFWNRLCVEQSLPERATAFPNESPTIWTSMCLALSHSCMRNTGDPTTSAFT